MFKEALRAVPLACNTPDPPSFTGWVWLRETILQGGEPKITLSLYNRQITSAIFGSPPCTSAVTLAVDCRPTFY